jgi:ATP-dependent Lon protease
MLLNLEDPGWLADLIASTLNVSLAKRQELLEILGPDERLQTLSTLLAEELGVLELENQIHEQVQRQIDDSQREYFLREQIRAIQEELGEGDEFQRDINDLEKRIHEAGMPEEVQTKAEKELARLRVMPPMAPESGVVRTYLEWLLDLPWNHPTILPLLNNFAALYTGLSNLS